MKTSDGRLAEKSHGVPPRELFANRMIEAASAARESTIGSSRTLGAVDAASSE
jgi:hypothetical protein